MKAIEIRNKYLNLTKKYTSLDELSKECPQADIYLTGSDQVWGKTENGEYDPAYCLSFTNGIKKSYAASFGNVINEPKVNEFFSKYLSSYLNITFIIMIYIFICNFLQQSCQINLVSPPAAINGNTLSIYKRCIIAG